MKDLRKSENRIIDHTMYSVLKDCPRKFHFSFILGLSHKDDLLRLPAEFGIAIHSALEALFSSQSEEEMRREEMNRAFVDSWGRFDGLDPRELRTTIKGLLILKKYVGQYGFPKREEIVKTEGLYSSPLMNGWIYSGKIDRVVFDGESESKEFVSPVDNKSSSVRNMICTNPNAQIVGYAFLLREEDYKVKSAMFDFLYFRKGRKGEDQWETISLEREEVSITDEIILEWAQDLGSYLAELERFLIKDYFPKNTNSCKDYGVCPFLFLCEIGVDYREIEGEIDLKDIYSFKEWSPLEGILKEGERI